MKGKSWRLVLAVGALTGAVGLGVGAEGAREPSAKVKKRLGEKAIEVMSRADRVEAFRIGPEPTAKKGKKNVAGYPILSRGKDQGQKFAARLASVLLEDGTLFGKGVRGFEPGVAFRMWHGEELVEVLICFKCDSLRVISHSGKGKVVKRASGAFGGHAGPLVKLAKEAFPDDKEIQALKEKPPVKKEK